MKTQSNLALANYLTSSASRSAFDVDVRGLSVQQIIPEYIQAKKATRPGIARQISGLVYNLTKLEEAYNVTIDPVQVTDVFWGLFVQFLRDQELKYSSIKTLTSQLRAVIEWASKHGAIVSKTYGDIEVPEDHTLKIALTADEVSWIYHYDIKSLKRRPQD